MGNRFRKIFWEAQSSQKAGRLHPLQNKTKQTKSSEAFYHHFQMDLGWPDRPLNKLSHKMAPGFCFPLTSVLHSSLPLPGKPAKVLKICPVSACRECDFPAFTLSAGMCLCNRCQKWGRTFCLFRSNVSASYSEGVALKLSSHLEN